MPSSKSESNRLLIIQALADQAEKVSNLSSARDTQTLLAILHEQPSIWDVKDAGTTMRFLTALAAVKGRHIELTGTHRMQQRPIGILVDALRTLGANIQYLNQEGFPPLQVGEFQYSGVNKLSIDGSVSSQFISALCMIAPLLPNGLKLHLTGEPSSVPYIDLTLASMQRAGIETNRSGAIISIKPGQYQLEEITVEPDWSSAGYWFSMALLSKQANIFLPGVKADSLQADAAIMALSKLLNFHGAREEGDGINLVKPSDTRFSSSKQITFDFSHCPDLAQTAIVFCCALGVSFKFSGLKSLKVKETDRVAALQHELKQFGIQLKESAADSYQNLGTFQFPKEMPVINTYEDHRMAMAFAPLALLGPIQIKEPGVVEKSYPEFWSHLKSIGFSIR